MRKAIIQSRYKIILKSLSNSIRALEKYQGARKRIKHLCLIHSKEYLVMPTTTIKWKDRKDLVDVEYVNILLEVYKFQKDGGTNLTMNLNLG